MLMKNTTRTGYTILSCCLALMLIAPGALAQMVEVQQKHTRDSESQHRRPGRGVGSAPMTPFEESIQALDADARVTKAVVEQISMQVDDPDEMVELTLSYDGVLDSSMWSDLEALGGSVVQVFSSINGCAVQIPADKADQLLSNSKITQVDWNAPIGFSMDVARTAAQMPVTSPPGGGGGKEIPMENIEGSQTQHGASTTGTLPENLDGDGVTIALIDSGVRMHLDLGNLVGCVDLRSPTTNPLDPYESTAKLAGDAVPCTDFTDPFGHGTHIAGILIGDGTASNGLYKGIAPGAELLSIRVLDDEGMADVADVITGIDWAIENKGKHDIDIISLSLGGPFFVPAAMDPLVQAVEAAWDADIVVVASAGNLGTYGNFTITRPGNSPKIITAGSLTDWNSMLLPDDMKSSYSSLSPTLIDGYLKPDLVAPGNRIVSTRAPGSALDQLLEPMGAVFGNVYLVIGE
jgi:subtilisin family serine protease